jgi:hypothetical protein
MLLNKNFMHDPGLASEVRCFPVPDFGVQFDTRLLLAMGALLPI